jgi:hypothetical protein
VVKDLEFKNYKNWMVKGLRYVVKATKFDQGLDGQRPNGRGLEKSSFDTNVANQLISLT